MLSYDYALPRRLATQRVDRDNIAAATDGVALSG